VQRLLAMIVAGAVAIAPVVCDASPAARPGASRLCCCPPASQARAGPTCCEIVAPNPSTASAGVRQDDAAYVDTSRSAAPRSPLCALSLARCIGAASGSRAPVLHLRI